MVNASDPFLRKASGHAHDDLLFARMRARGEEEGARANRGTEH